MAAKTLCIELGDRLIKVCERSSAKTHVSKRFSFPTPDGLVQDGQVSDPAALGAALKNALSANGLGLRKSAVFVLQSGKVAAREVKLPPVRDNRIKAMVESNAAEYFPVDMSKYHISYTVLERREKGDDPFVRLQVLAVPMALLEGFFQVAEAAGLRVENIENAGTCRYNVLRAFHSEGVTMYIDVGCTTSDVIIMQDGLLMLQRSFPVGGDELIYAQLGADGKTDKDYADVMAQLCEGKTTLPDEAVVDSLNRLTGNIVRIADYFNSNNWETPVEKLVLLGDCAALAGFRSHVEESVTYPVEMMAELPGYSLSAGAHSTPLRSGYLACVGCPLERGLFLPENMGKQKKAATKHQSESLTLGIIVCVGCFVIGAALTASSFFGYRSALSDKRAAEREIAYLEPARTTYNTYVDYKAAADGFQTVYADAQKPNAQLSDFIAELEKKMPSQISVLSAVCTNESVSMNVMVDSKDAAAAVIVQLRSFESLSDVAVGAISETEDENGIVQVNFAVTCSYPAPAADETAAAATTATATEPAAAPKN